MCIQQLLSELKEMDALGSYRRSAVRYGTVQYSTVQYSRDESERKKKVSTLSKGVEKEVSHISTEELPNLVGS